MSKELYIIRHGQTDFNLQGIVQGQGMDTDLNDFGKQQAQAFFEAYRNEGFDFIYTSCLKRTHQTVAPFLSELHLPTKALHAFDEFNWGIFEGTKFGQFNAEYRALIAAWSSGDYAAAPPLGDSPMQVAVRQRMGIAHIMENQAHKILLCMHGRAMRLFLCLLMDRPFSEMETFEHDNLSLYKMVLHDKGNSMLLRNDRSHLQKLV